MASPSWSPGSTSWPGRSAWLPASACQRASSSPAFRGHAIEVRLYAEDPYRDFRPTGGRIGAWRMPSGPGVRVDAGVEADTDLPSEYDPLLAKLMVHADDRPTAVARLRRALDETLYRWAPDRRGIPCDGWSTTQGSSMASTTPGSSPSGGGAARSRRPRSEHSRRWRRSGPAGSAPCPAPGRAPRPMAAAWASGRSARGAATVSELEARIEEKAVRPVDGVSLELARSRRWACPRHRRRRSRARFGRGRWHGLGRDAPRASHRRDRQDLARACPGRGRGRGSGRTRVRSIVRATLPGLVVAVPVAVGDEVDEGAVLLTIEAMKMQNEVRAPRAGRVIEVSVAAGQTVMTGAPLSADRGSPDQRSVQSVADD